MITADDGDVLSKSHGWDEIRADEGGETGATVQ